MIGSPGHPALGRSAPAAACSMAAQPPSSLPPAPPRPSVSAHKPTTDPLWHARPCLPSLPKSRPHPHHAGDPLLCHGPARPRLQAAADGVGGPGARLARRQRNRRVLQHLVSSLIFLSFLCMGDWGARPPFFCCFPAALFACTRVLPPSPFSLSFPLLCFVCRSCMCPAWAGAGCRAGAPTPPPTAPLLPSARPACPQHHRRGALRPRQARGHPAARHHGAGPPALQHPGVLG